MRWSKKGAGKKQDCFFFHCAVLRGAFLFLGEGFFRKLCGFLKWLKSRRKSPSQVRFDIQFQILRSNLHYRVHRFLAALAHDTCCQHCGFTICYPVTLEEPYSLRTATKVLRDILLQLAPSYNECCQGFAALNFCALICGGSPSSSYQ